MQSLQDAAVQWGVILLNTLGPVLVAGLVGLLGVAINRWRIKLGAEANAAEMANLSTGTRNSNTLAIMQSLPAIAEKGWNDPGVQRKLISGAAAILAIKSPDTLAASGIDPTTDEGRAKIEDVVTRDLPAAIAEAAASPATPPVEDPTKVPTAPAPAALPAKKQPK